MRVKVTIVGALERVIPGGEDVIETDGITAAGVVDALAQRHGPRVAEELRGASGLREGLSLLVNGRNALSLPDRFETRLQDGDEVVITVQVTGGRTRRNDS